MKTERELFEEWFKDYHSNNEAYAEQIAWQAWQASVSRQGYKLVPVDKKECCELMCSQCFNG